MDLYEPVARPIILWVKYDYEPLRNQNIVEHGMGINTNEVKV